MAYLSMAEVNLKRTKAINLFNLKENNNFETFGKIIVRETNYDLITAYSLLNLEEIVTREKVIALTSAFNDDLANELFINNMKSDYITYVDLLNASWKLCSESEIVDYYNKINKRELNDFIKGKEYSKIKKYK